MPLEPVDRTEAVDERSEDLDRTRRSGRRTTCGADAELEQPVDRRAGIRALGARLRPLEKGHPVDGRFTEDGQRGMRVEKERPRDGPVVADTLFPKEVKRAPLILEARFVPRFAGDLCQVGRRLARAVEDEQEELLRAVPAWRSEAPSAAGEVDARSCGDRLHIARRTGGFGGMRPVDEKATAPRDAVHERVSLQHAQGIAEEPPSEDAPGKKSPLEIRDRPPVFEWGGHAHVSRSRS